MKHKLLLLFALTLGLASNVWAELGTTTIGGKTYYQIGTAQDLLDFAELVNDGTTGANAVLTTDITLADNLWTNPIGKSSYTGHFDGQGHTINNLTYTTNQNNHGLFGKLAAGAVVENFSINGTITNSDYDAIAVIGYTSGTTVNIRNIHSDLSITNSGNDKKIGGIVGNGNQGTTNIDHCAFFGELYANDKTNAGGIVGYFKNGDDAIVNITNCLFDGIITSEISNAYCGGIAGYGGGNVNKVKIKNCLSLGTLDAPVKGQFFGNIRNTGSSITKCYYQGSNINGTGSSTLTTQDATAVSQEQLSSGEVCVLLNGTDFGENWYQDLSNDDYPTPYGTYKVYKYGSYKCDMAPKTDVISYTNTPAIDSHGYENGFCSYCGDPDADYASFIAPNEDGVYEIDDKDDLVWFAAFVNAGTTGANIAAKAKLTNDIDMKGADLSNFPIGRGASDGGKRYTGIFDGQFHKISNFKLSFSSANCGMFNTGDSVILKNFWLDGTCEIVGTTEVGLIGRHDGKGSFEGLGSYAPITGTTNHVGGLIGAAWGRIKSGATKKEIKIINCWTAGKVTSDSNGGAICGWFNHASKVKFENCWTIAEVTHPAADDKYIFDKGAESDSPLDVNDYCYSKKGVQSFNTITDDDVASGKLCYMLNGNQSEINWYQALVTDADDFPTPYSSSSKRVYQITTSPNYVNSIAADQYLQINYPAELKQFANLVNAGNTTMNAALAEDLDCTSISSGWTPIGGANNTESEKYKGTFDGKGHIISNLKIDMNAAYAGIFSTTAGVTLKNFIVDSSCSIKSSSNMVGVVCIHQASASSATSTSTFSGIGNAANVTSTGGENPAGLIGGCWGKKNVAINIENCWTSGTIQSSNSKPANTGAFVGWINGGKLSVNNSWSIATVNSAANDKYLVRPASNSNTSVTFSNCYSKNGTQVTQKDDAAFASGEVCYLLNGDQSEINWYQTLGTDTYPTLDSSKPNVYEIAVSGAGYASFVPTVNVAAIPDDITVYAGQDNGTYLHLEEVTELPANAAVIVKADEGTYYYNNTNEERTLGVENDLLYSANAFSATGSEYCLADKTLGVGFYKVNEGVTIPARKVYLSVTSPVKAFYGFFDDDETSLNRPTPAPSLNGGEVYDLSGRKIANGQKPIAKGIYIVKGCKVLF